MSCTSACSGCPSFEKNTQTVGYQGVEDYYTCTTFGIGLPAPEMNQRPNQRPCEVIASKIMALQKEGIELGNMTCTVTRDQLLKVFGA